MLYRNAARILNESLRDTDVVLDCGGWARPFRRANYVVDLLPYETRGILGHEGSDQECFSRETWVVHDLSSTAPLPFGDKTMDFVICSHVLVLVERMLGHPLYFPRGTELWSSLPEIHSR